MKAQTRDWTATIWFLGDVHGKFRHVSWHIEQTPAERRPKAVVFLGDIEAQRPLEEELRPLEGCGVDAWWIIGNHDTDSAKNWSFLQGAKDRCIDGRVVDVGGVKLAGLGGIFRGEVWMPDGSGKGAVHRNYGDYAGFLRNRANLKRRLSPKEAAMLAAVPDRQWAAQQLDQSREGKLLKHCSTIFPDTYDSLALRTADVLVTHEAPSCHRHGFAEIDLLATVMGVRLVVHGHHHEGGAYPGTEGRMGFRTLGVGLRGITAMDGTVVKAGEHDRRLAWMEGIDG